MRKKKRNFISSRTKYLYDSQYIIYMIISIEYSKFERCFNLRQEDIKKILQVVAIIYRFAIKHVPLTYVGIFSP